MSPGTHVEAMAPSSGGRALRNAQSASPECWHRPHGSTLGRVNAMEMMGNGNTRKGLPVCALSVHTDELRVTQTCTVLHSCVLCYTDVD